MGGCAYMHRNGRPGVQFCTALAGQGRACMHFPGQPGPCIQTPLGRPARAAAGIWKSFGAGFCSVEVLRTRCLSNAHVVFIRFESFGRH